MPESTTTGVVRRLVAAPPTGRRVGGTVARMGTNEHAPRATSKTGGSLPGLLSGILLLAAVGAGCSSSDGPSASEPSGTAPTASTAGPDDQELVEPAEVGTYRVGRVEVVLVDGSRPTKAHGGQPERRERTLPTVVWYPAVGDASAAAGADLPFADGGDVPLIVFSHGSTRNAEDYAATLTAWASAGYVVAAPNFPLSTTGVPGGTDYGGAPEQAGDVSFVITHLLVEPGAAPGAPAHPWAGRIDAERIGLGGQSFGAITTLVAASDPCCADDRVVAVTEFAGFGGGGPEGRPGPPALFVHGDADPTVGYDAGRGAFAGYPGDASFLTLHGAGHDDGFFGGVGDPLDELVTRSTLAFYDRHLKGDDGAADRLRHVVAEAGPEVASLDEP